MSDDPLIPVFMPSLLVLFAHDEVAKGSPLTRDEVVAIRDQAETVMLPRSKLIEIASRRGYEDIDPERAYEEWQLLRAELKILHTPDDDPGSPGDDPYSMPSTFPSD
jgi:hypothetical protein